MDKARYVLQLFAKAPQAGRVKTRLQGVLGEAACLDLHCQLIIHCFDQLAASGEAVELHCSEAHNFFASLPTTALRIQRGKNLGERMFNAAQAALGEYDGVILVGADCPFVDAAYLERAIAALESGVDAVVGPAQDGGYVLLGLRRVARELFDSIPWGGAQVMQLTRQRLRTLQWQWLELPTSMDIDRPEDLLWLREVPGFEWLPV